MNDFEKTEMGALMLLLDSEAVTLTYVRALVLKEMDSKVRNSEEETAMSDAIDKHAQTMRDLAETIRKALTQ